MVKRDPHFQDPILRRFYILRLLPLEKKSSSLDSGELWRSVKKIFSQSQQDISACILHIDPFWWIASTIDTLMKYWGKWLLEVLEGSQMFDASLVVKGCFIFFGNVQRLRRFYSRSRNRQFKSVASRGTLSWFSTRSFSSVYPTSRFNRRCLVSLRC